MKYVTAAASAALLAAFLTGCAKEGGSGKNMPSKPAVIAEIGPIYEWTAAVLGENPAGIELSLLIENGVDLHSFQPTVADMIRVSDADLVLYVGGESDAWMEDAAAEAANRAQKAEALLDHLGDLRKEEEHTEGMQGHHHGGHEEHEDHDSHEDHGDHEEGPEYDEHIWLSLKNAEVLTKEIAALISELDPTNKALYEANAEIYCEKLSALETEYADALLSPARPLLFADRFPFLYLASDYELPYYAAFSGCSADTNASFETITFLSKKVDECGIGVILIIDESMRGLAETVRDNTSRKDQKILRLDSMQGPRPGGEEEKDYLTIMRENLEILRMAAE